MALSLDNFIIACYNTPRWRVYNIERFQYSTHGIRIGRIPVEDKGAFNKYMKINLAEDIIELPCAYKYIISNTLSYNLNNPQDAIDTLYVPLYYLDQYTEVSKSSNSLIKAFFYDSPNNINLIKRPSTNGVYLGCPGMILYEDYTPLMMYTLKVEKVLVSGIYKYRPIESILRINPIIYSRDDMLAKYIKTKLIACSVDSNIWPTREVIKNLNGIYSTIYIDLKFKVLIDDFSDFFEVPSLPDTTFSSEKVNELLYDNLENVLSEI